MTKLQTNGPVHRPGSDGYERERDGYQLLEQHRPELIVAAADAQDVRAAVRYAAARNQGVAVQATGHGLGGAATGGVLISTRAWREVRVDARARTAWVGAGARWHDVIDAAAPFGLAPLSGSAPGVGVVSYTLAGGIGLTARRYGYAADHVRRIEVVTADGLARTVDVEHEPELFWALRGGGGNFGVVTGLEIDLVPLTEFYGGGLFFDLAAHPEILEAWRQWTETVPEEVTSAVSMLPYPDLEGVPEPLRGKRIAQLQIAVLGTAEYGNRLIAPLREIAPTVRDTMRLLPYTKSGEVFADPDTPHAYRSTNLALGEPGEPSLAALPAATDPAEPVMCVLQLRHLGGALAKSADNAVGNRAARYSLGALSPVQPGALGQVRARHRDVLAPFEPVKLGRMLGFTFDELSPEAVREGYEQSDYARLVRLKREYDPGNLFRYNHNIPPTETG